MNKNKQENKWIITLLFTFVVSIVILTGCSTARNLIHKVCSTALSVVDKAEAIRTNVVDSVPVIGEAVK